MALLTTSLSGKIETEIKAVYGNPTDSDKLKDFCDALAKAIVEEITTNAVVVGTVTSGPGAGGDVTGTLE
jgi:hypothetical protein